MENKFEILALVLSLVVAVSQPRTKTEVSGKQQRLSTEKWSGGGGEVAGKLVLFSWGYAPDRGHRTPWSVPVLAKPKVRSGLAWAGAFVCWPSLFRSGPVRSDDFVCQSGSVISHFGPIRCLLSRWPGRIG